MSKSTVVKAATESALLASSSEFESECEPPSYEAALEELEQLLARMESQNLPLDDWVHAHARAQLLLDFCQGKLQTVENQIQVLEGNSSSSGLPLSRSLKASS